jgi:drug/metabolite transporter (DMT)-like permease
MSAGLALGLIASLAWGLVDITGALASRRLGSLRVLAGSQIVSLVALVVMVRRGPRLTRWCHRGRPGRAAAGVGAALAYLCYFTALRIGPLSVVSPVIVAYGGTTVVLAVLLRGETLQPPRSSGPCWRPPASSWRRSCSTAGRCGARGWSDRGSRSPS